MPKNVKRPTRLDGGGYDETYHEEHGAEDYSSSHDGGEALESLAQDTSLEGGEWRRALERVRAALALSLTLFPSNLMVASPVTPRRQRPGTIL